MELVERAYFIYDIAERSFYTYPVNAKTLDHVLLFCHVLVLSLSEKRGVCGVALDRYLANTSPCLGNELYC